MKLLKIAVKEAIVDGERTKKKYVLTHSAVFPRQ